MLFVYVMLDQESIRFSNFQCENGIYVCQITRMGVSGNKLLLACLWLHRLIRNDFLQ